MIKENQTLLNRLHVLSDGAIVYLFLPLAWWLRMAVLPGGVPTVGLGAYLRLGVGVTAGRLFTYAAFGLYDSFRKTRFVRELERLILADLLDTVLVFSWLFASRNPDYSRLALALYFLLSFAALAAKRAALRKLLKTLRRRGRNLKHVLLLGSGPTAARCLRELQNSREFGLHPVGYLSAAPAPDFQIPRLGGFGDLETVLGSTYLDEVISAISLEEYGLTPRIIRACEDAGVKLSILPFYAEYMPAHPQFDDLNGIPLLNLRRVPLDNFANAFLKRAADLVGAALLLAVCSPLLLVCALGVRLSSPGPVLFRQTRIGRHGKPFTMLKFRSMRLNGQQDTAWSAARDSRRTRFGALLRKYSLDELPQLVNCLRGEMSLVGPRPEIPHFVERFREEVPLYMIRHQVRPGITGWAQIHGLRGDTSIKKRIEYDIDYIENWSPWLDVQILLSTVFRGKFVNQEVLDSGS